jgi:hypothetical protein
MDTDAIRDTLTEAIREQCEALLLISVGQRRRKTGSCPYPRPLL